MTDPARYPGLFEEQVPRWRDRLRMNFEVELPDPDLITNVRVLCFVKEDVVLITTEEFGLVGLPGGTLEPDETLEQGLARELLEEVGAVLRAWEIVARIRFRSQEPTPYRDHMPHPVFHWAVGHADVALVADPTNPPDAETVTAVEVVPLAEACDRLARKDAWEASLVACVADIRNAGRRSSTAG